MWPVLCFWPMRGFPGENLIFLLFASGLERDIISPFHSQTKFWVSAKMDSFQALWGVCFYFEDTTWQFLEITPAMCEGLHGILGIEPIHACIGMQGKYIHCIIIPFLSFIDSFKLEGFSYISSFFTIPLATSFSRMLFHWDGILQKQFCFQMHF